jgi:hypothetical protein
LLALGAAVFRTPSGQDALVKETQQQFSLFAAPTNKNNPVILITIPPSNTQHCLPRFALAC